MSENLTNKDKTLMSENLTNKDKTLMSENLTNKALPVNGNKITPSGHHHSFDVRIAYYVGIECAILFSNLCYWITHNKIRGINSHEGRTWTYDTPRTMSEHMPYISPKQITFYLNRLVEYGLIMKNNFNKNKFDRTSWYALVDESVLTFSKNVFENPNLGNGQNNDQNTFPKSENSISQISDVHFPNLGNVVYTHSIPDTIPDNTHTTLSNPEPQNAAVVTAVAVASADASPCVPLTLSIDPKTEPPPPPTPLPKKTKRKTAEFSKVVRDVTADLLEQVHKSDPKHPLPKNLVPMMEQVEAMIEKDGCQPLEISETMAWALADNTKSESGDWCGWCPIMIDTNPAKKLRKNFGKIRKRMGAKEKRKFAPCSDDKAALDLISEWRKSAI